MERNVTMAVDDQGKFHFFFSCEKCEEKFNVFFYILDLDHATRMGHLEIVDDPEIMENHGTEIVAVQKIKIDGMIEIDDVHGIVIARDHHRWKRKNVEVDHVADKKDVEIDRQTNVAVDHESVAVHGIVDAAVLEEEHQ